MEKKKYISPRSVIYAVTPSTIIAESIPFGPGDEDPGVKRETTDEVGIWDLY